MSKQGGGRNTGQQNVNVVPHYCCAIGNGTWNKALFSIVTTLQLKHHVAGTGEMAGVLSCGDDPALALVFSRLLSICHIFLPLSTQHCAYLIHVRQLFDGEEGKEENRSEGKTRDAGRGRWNWRIVFIILYLFSELQHPVLYSHLHPLIPRPTWAAHTRNCGVRCHE